MKWQSLAILPVTIYRRIISPLFPPCCRFYPTCSSYAMQALQLHPLPFALLLIFKRLLRCHPFAKAGVDPVPQPCVGHDHSHPTCQGKNG